MQTDKGLIFITGASGAGKTHLQDRCLREIRGVEKLVTSTSSRGPRNGEVHGVDYLFRSKPELEEKIAQGKMFEYEPVFGDGSWGYYGIEYEELERIFSNGYIPMTHIDIKGALKMQAQREFPALVMYLDVPYDILEERIAKDIQQNKRPGEDFAKRLQRIREVEIPAKKDFNIVIGNSGHPDIAFKTLRSVIHNFMKVKIPSYV